MRESPPQRKAVFLHAGWRCASTYVWSRFRRNPSTTSFYEPFGEALARCSPKRVQRQTADGWNSRHPPLAMPYAEEYCPLLRPLLRGVPGYRETFALARYFPTEAGIGPEIRYVSRLIGHARRQDTHAVLGFSRSLGRAAALKHALGGYHVLVRRNPVQQWLSCRSYRGEVPLSYFELCHFLILALAPEGSPARRFARMLGLPRLPRGLQRQFEFLHSALHPWSDELSYRAFTAVSLLSHAAAEPAADLVLDVDRLDRSPAYRDSVSARILAGTGLEIDFSDCRIPSHDVAGVSLDFASLERGVRERVDAFGAEPGPTQVPLSGISSSLAAMSDGLELLDTMPQRFASAGAGGIIDRMCVPPDHSDENEALARLRQQLQTESNDGLSLLENINDNPICALGVDETVPCVTVEWKSYSTSTQLRFVHEHILRFLKSHRMRAVLGDDTALPTIHTEDQRWIVEDWLPRARAAGLKAAASKEPRTYFGKLAVSAVQAIAPTGVELRSFEKIEDARDWLRSAVANRA